MIKINNFYFGDYYQKIFTEGNRIVDAECKCRWGKVHKKAWKEGTKICKHLDDAIIQLNRDIKYQQRKNGKKS